MRGITLARAELRKRRLLFERDDPALQGAFAALRKGVSTLPGFVRFSDSVCALADRIDTDTLTVEDKLTPSMIPACPLSAEQLVALFAEIERAY